MILTDAFWPVFALSSWFSAQGQGQADESLVKHHKHHHHKHHGHHKHDKQPFPGHTLYQLNDGNLIPSPAWGTGTATAREGNATELVGQALEAGWRHIDTSLIYRNQNGTGEALKASGIPRDQLYITSKYDAMNNATVTEEIQTTLAQLQLEYLDLYLIHFPRAAVNGGGIEKVWKEMEQLKKNGTVRSIGISNYDTVELLGEVLRAAEVFPAINQINYSVYNAVDKAETIAFGMQHGVLFSAYGELRPITRSPNGPADVIGKQITERLSKDFGKEVTYAQMIFDWLKSTGVIAVTTTSNKERLTEQLVPFGADFPLVTAAEARAFEASGWGYDE